jgi:hypothetical protein
MEDRPMKVTCLLLPAIATSLMAAPATWAQMTPSQPSHSSAAVGAPGPSKLPAAKEVQGTVQSVDQAKKHLTFTDGTTLTLAPTAQVAPAASKKGAKVIAMYQEQGGQKIVTVLRLAS